MIKLQALDISDFAYEKGVFEEVRAYHDSITGWQKEFITNSAGGTPIYGYFTGLAKPIIYLHGQVHGAHEWRTTWWVGKFMEILMSPEKYPQHTELMQDLKRRYDFYIVPSWNPDGYDSGEYGNANGVSITENFDYMWENSSDDPTSPYYRGTQPFTEPETIGIRDLIYRIKPLSLICTHTWGGHDGFCVRIPQNNQYRLLLRDMFRTIYQTVNESGETDAVFAEMLNGPSTYNWAGEINSPRNHKMLTCVFETGSLKSNFDQARVGVNGLLIYCMYVDMWFTQQVNIMNG